MKTSRNTIQRSLILQAVRSLHQHPTAEEIYQETLKYHPTISKATVYRNLNLLVQQGEILKVEVPDGADHFDFKLQYHHHAYCRKCSNVYGMEMPTLEEVMERAKEPPGFLLEECSILFRGVCSKCKQK
ncbi:MAG: transcriptional repressor [Clostridia bacterium]|nr:transcriptional repressor [Clostridia bacterium]